MPRLDIAAAVLILAATALAQPTELEILRTFDGGDEAMLYRPDAVAFGPDGSIYVLNAGDCRVLRYDPDWQLVRAFGREGEGPAEFNNPTGMLIRDDELWVFEQLRATIFGLDGAYVRTLASRPEMHEPIETDRGLLVRLGSSDRLAALLDQDLAITEKVGPECPADADFMTRFKTCGFVHVLPHPDHLALLLNPFDGHLWVLGEDGSVVRELDLVDDPGRSSSQTDDDGNISMRFTMVMATGGVDRHGNLWTLPVDPAVADDEDAPQLVVVRDRAFEVIAEYVLPPETNASRVVHAPDGTLLLLDGNASLIHVAAYPDAMVAP
ncbi:hypothetical protein GF314_05310 [bacterium]|nr:hypothetical protein [bacterium]